MALNLLLVSAALAGDGGVREVLYAQPFVLEAPYRDDWSAEHPPVDRGTVLVLRVDPERVRPTQRAMPVLYVDGRPAERANLGWPSGVVMAVVPATVNPLTTRIWFGEPELPERIDAARGKVELLRATEADEGLVGFAVPPEAPLHAKDVTGLYFALAPVLERFAPDERDLAGAWRLPLAR